MEVLTLRELQIRFSQALRNRDEFCSQEYLSGRENPPISFEERFEIYHYSYWVRLRDLVRGDYPRILKLLGPKGFDRMFTAFITEFPSGDPHISELSGHLPAFLREREPWMSKPWLREVARFEWALDTTFLTPEDPPIDPAGITGDVVLSLAPPTQLFESAWEVDEVRRTLPKIARKKTQLVIFRESSGKVFTRRVNQKQWNLLCELRRSQTLLQLSVFLEAGKYQSRRVSEWVSLWASEGVLQARSQSQ